MDKMRYSQDVLAAINKIKLEKNETSGVTDENFMNLKKGFIGLRGNQLIRNSKAKEVDILKFYFKFD